MRIWWQIASTEGQSLAAMPSNGGSNDAGWLNGCMQDCCPAVPGSNPASPQPTTDCLVVATRAGSQKAFKRKKSLASREWAMADWKNLLDCWGAVSTEEGDGAAKVNNSWIGTVFRPEVHVLVRRGAGCSHRHPVGSE
jgi:hypothetical protein